MSKIQAIIIAAMEEEVLPFIDWATEVSELTAVGNSIHREATLSGVRTLLVQGGIGLVNASSAATSALLRAQHLNAIAAPEPNDSLDKQPLLISAGTAGGLGGDVRVGQVVIGEKVVNADADVRAFGYELGQVPGMPASYSPAPELAAASRVDPASGGLVDTIHHGLMISSYSFVGPERATVMKELYPGVLCTDMESSAIAQVAHSFGASFIAVRGVSDLCGPASDADFLTHVDDAAERSSEVVLQLLAAVF